MVGRMKRSASGDGGNRSNSAGTASLVPAYYRVCEERGEVACFSPPANNPVWVDHRFMRARVNRSITSYDNTEINCSR